MRLNRSSKGPPPRLDGIFVAAATPFDAVTGELDTVALRANIRAWLATSIRGLLIAGSTGEGPLLDPDERIAVLGAAREALPGDRLLIAGTGAESTHETIKGTRRAADAGADLVLIQPPSFYGEAMDRTALEEHYTHVADASPVPVLLYQPPLRFATVELPTALIEDLSRHPNVVGLKDSRGDMQTLGEILERTEEGFQYLTGAAGRLQAALEMGAVGAVLAVANFAPAEACELMRAHAAGRTVEADRIQERLVPIGRDIVAARGVAGVKTAMDLVGFKGGPPRAPLRPLDSKGAHAVRAALEEAEVALTRSVA